MTQRAATATGPATAPFGIEQTGHVATVGSPIGSTAV